MLTIMESLPRYATDEVLDGEAVCTTPEESDAHMNAIINASEVHTDIHIAAQAALSGHRTDRVASR